MKEIIKNGVALWLRSIVVVIMCIFLCMSMTVLSTALFADEVGYYATAVKEKEETIEYEFLYADGKEDAKKAELEADGYEVSISKKKVMTNGGNIAFLVITQIFCILLSISFVYPNLWSLGAKDSNLVRFKHKKEDILKGLKIGVVGSIPALLMWVGLIVCKFAAKSLPTALYKFLNCNNFSFIYAICRDETVGELSFLQLALLLLPLTIIPATAFGAYLLGYKDISLGERFIYKKNKK